MKDIVEQRNKASSDLFLWNVHVLAFDLEDPIEDLGGGSTGLKVNRIDPMLQAGAEKFQRVVLRVESPGIAVLRQFCLLALTPRVVVVTGW